MGGGGGPEGTEFCCSWRRESLTSESVQGPALPLQGVDNIHSGHSLPLGVLGVGNCITDDILKENFEDSTGLLVDQAGDTFYSSPASKTTDSGLGDALDIVTQYLPVTLGASLSKTLSSFTTAGHDSKYSSLNLDAAIQIENNAE